MTFRARRASDVWNHVPVGVWKEVGRRMKLPLAVLATFLAAILILASASPVSAAGAVRYPLCEPGPFGTFFCSFSRGFCTLSVDGNGGLYWHIKTNALDPGATGHFDLGHDAAETDVAFTASSGGTADSLDQTVPAATWAGTNADLTDSVSCQVHLTAPGDHSDSPGTLTTGLVPIPQP